MEITPLAEKLRPKNLEEFIGQKHIISNGCELSLYFQNRTFPSMIFWGPPGSGKTTLAKLISISKPDIPFFSESAVKIGVKRIREITMANTSLSKTSIILFLDEIHRFSKSQQDVLLPYVEKGDMILIGATTENPSFYLISPLISRCRLFILKKLTEDNITEILQRAVNKIDTKKPDFTTDNLKLISQASEGDARRALNTLEALLKNRNIDKKNFSDYLSRILIYDKRGDCFYDLISAFHKSVRSSDPQGTIYYLARMIISGCDPAYIMRRMIRIAVEDIGLADPQALVITTQAREAFDYVGLPEADLILVEAALYLATAPKSNSLYKAWQSVSEIIKSTGSIDVPINLRNAPTKIAKELGHGKNYKYDHDYPNAFSGQMTLPDKLKYGIFYKPNSRGFEKEIKKRMQWWENRREEIK